MLPINQYLNVDYPGDLAVFRGSFPPRHGIAGLICGWTIDNLLAEDRVSGYTSPDRFLCVQYAMNLLNQAIWSYFRTAHLRWINSCAPFLTSRCAMAHGGIHSPESILKYAAKPWAREHVRIEISESLLDETERFFIPAYVESLPGMRRVFHLGLISGNALLQHILADKDCCGFAVRHARREGTIGAERT